MADISISHAVYLVPESAAAVNFLRDILGFEVSADEISITGDRFLTMSSSSEATGLELQLVESSLQPRIAALKAQVGAVEFILDVHSASEVVQSARDAGLIIHREPTAASYGVTAIFEDPFGYRWDVVERGGDTND